LKYRNGQYIVLKNNSTEAEVSIKIIMYDSIQGWLGEKLGSVTEGTEIEKPWNWYALNTYTFVKQLPKDRNVLT
jgi:hypothetical protein|tara:strand:- start:1567 stop:1788 length:222 start_codon:yes stop_codon:yes gene_type:complete